MTDPGANGVSSELVPGESLAVVTIWLLVFVVADALLSSVASNVAVAGLAGGVAFVLSRRYLRARRGKESS